jgi:hypothetical protein
VWSPSRQLPARATPYVHVLRDRHMQHGGDPASDGLTQRQSSPCRDGRSAGSREWTGQSADAAGSAFFRAVHGRWDTCTRYIYIYSLTHSLTHSLTRPLHFSPTVSSSIGHTSIAHVPAGGNERENGRPLPAAHVLDRSLPLLVSERDVRLG